VFFKAIVMSSQRVDYRRWKFSGVVIEIEIDNNDLFFVLVTEAGLQLNIVFQNKNI
jgi:hypothetical protein